MGTNQYWLVQDAVIVALTVALTLLGTFLFRRFLSHTPAASAGANPMPRPGAETDWSQSLRNFQAAPVALPHDSAPADSPAASAVGGADKPDAWAGKPGERQALLQEFLESAPSLVATLQGQMADCRQLQDQKSQRDALARIAQEINLLKYRSALPDLRPFWLLCTSVEGLLQQLLDRTSHVNQSSLRTIASAVELLRDLCARGINPDLATSPPARILIVDDDSVTRYTLKVAMKKLFDEPDMAENGRSALVKARSQRYDLIVLDVMLPDLDGFEILGNIRESGANASTPVLFVTGLAEFDARIRTHFSDGSDLVGKPFLAMEMAVKTLTMVMRARLRTQNRAPAANQAVNAPVLWPDLAANGGKDGSSSLLANAPGQTDQLDRKPTSGPIVLLPPSPLVPAANPSPAGGALAVTLNPAFEIYVKAFVAEVKEDLKLIAGAKEHAASHETLIRVVMRLQTLSRRINMPELRPAFEVCTAVEGLTRKLCDNPKKVTSSALRTAEAAMDLFQDLCVPGIRPDLTSQPAIRLLVVDDEPLARRALGGLLQLSFGRPDLADGGDSALALAAQKGFDLVFLDVCMPEMDGFAVCEKIHETAANRRTPVVFVTSHSGPEFQACATKSGGRDYVVKPVDFVEIPVKALTHVVRGRLERLKPAPEENVTAAQPPTK